jgi:hypothetical protein
MSKTSQRKKSFYDLGRSDFKRFKFAMKPFYGDEELNRCYMRGFKFEERNYDLKHCRTLLQWFRVKFCMETA